MDSRELNQRYEADLNRAMEESLASEEPMTYVGRSTGAIYAEFCCLGAAIAEGVPHTSHECCSHVGCICKAEEDSSFRMTTEAEALLFWQGMAVLADRGAFEEEHDL